MADMDESVSNDGVQPGTIEKPVQIDRSSSHAQGTTVLATDDVDANLARVDDAIEAIGWGKYQWQLAITCGFGFLVDQVGLLNHSYPHLPKSCWS